MLNITPSFIQALRRLFFHSIMSTSPTAPSAAPQPHIPESASGLEAFLDRHFRTVVYVCIAAIALVAISGIVRYRNRQAAEEAAFAATAAKTVDDCDIVIQKYKGSVAAGNALLTKAKLLWDDNKKDKAVATLRDFVSGYTSHPFYVQGQLSLASRLEALGGNEAKEAQTILEKIVSAHKDSEVAGLAQIRLADQLWSQGKEEEAKKIYDELPRKFIGQFPDMVDERVKWLGAALPTKEVDAPKPPPAALKAPADNPAIQVKPQGPPGSKPLPIEIKPQITPANGAVKPAPAPGTAAVGTPPVKITPSATTAPIKVEAKPAPAPAATPAPAPVPAPTEPKK